MRDDKTDLDLANPCDDEVVSRRVEFHEALVAGSESVSNVADDSAADPSRPFQDVESCFRMMERVRRGQGADQTGRTVDSALSATGDGEFDGTQIGRFKLLRILGQGGCGIVFLAVDPQLGRQVALKIPRPESLVNPELRRRFLREGEASAGLKHPHIVPIHEAGEIGPVCYLVQEYCEGGTLAQWLADRREPLEPKSAASLMAQLATAVHFAHSRGVLHRDLKPGNILLESNMQGASVDKKTDSELGFTAKVADFGLAKLMDATGDATTQGLVVGTPAYMAPEQAQGRQDDVGTHTDVYALGVILFELLTGRPPIIGDSDMDTIIRISAEEPAFRGEWKRQLPRDLRAVCLKCLEKKPKLRYASAGALAEDLRRFVTGQPTEAHPLGHFGRIVKWCRRRPSLAALVLVSALAMIGLLAGSWWHATRLGNALQVAEQQRTKAESLRVKAQQSEQRTLQEMYATHIGVAQEALSRGDLNWALEFLKRYGPHEEKADLREFTWHYLWKKCHGYRSLLQGHEGDVYYAMFSPDGHRLATAGKDGTAKVWGTATGELLMTLIGHASEVNVVEFSPDGAIIATTSDDETIKLWDAATGSERSTLVGHAGVIVCLAFSPDGKTLVSGGEDGVARRWDVETSQQQTALAENLDSVDAISFSPDGQTLAICSHGEGVQIRDFATGQLQRTLIDHKGQAVCQAFSHDGKMLATGDLISDVRIWDVATGGEILAFHGHSSGVYSVDFSPDDRVLVSGSRDSSVRFWDTETGKLMKVLPAHTDRVWSVALAPDGRTLATASEDGTAKIWGVPRDYRTVDVVHVPTGFSETMATFSSSGDLILSGRDATVDLWSFVYSRFGIDSGTGEISFRKRESAELTGLFDEHVERIRSAVYSLNRKHVAVASRDGTIKLWDPKTRRVRRTLLAPEDSVRFLAFSADGNTLASGGTEPYVRFWDVDSGDLVSTTESHGNPIVYADSSPRESRLVTVNTDGEVALWQFNQKNNALLWHRHFEGVGSVVFSPDGATIASGSLDGKVRFWHMQTGQELLTIDTELGHIYCVTFAQDGKVFAASGKASGNGKHTIQLWNVAVDVP